MPLGIAEVLQQQRKTLGMTISEAARLGDVPRAYLSMIEAGKRAPSPQTIVRLMAGLQIPIASWLPAYLGEETRCQQLMRLANLLFGQGSYDASRQVLSRAYFVSRNEQDGRYNTDIYYLLGKVYYATGKYTKALRWIRLLDRATRHFQEPQMQAVATYNMAQVLARVGQRVEALRKFDEADESFVRLRQWFYVGRTALGKANVLLAMHAYPEAYEAYRRAAYFLRSKDFHGDARLGEAITMAALQGPEASLPIFRAIVDSNNVGQLVRVKARTNLAAKLRQLGRHEDALTEIAAGLAEAGSLPSPLLAGLFAEATICHMLLRDFPAALQTFERYKSLEGPKDGEDVAAMHIVAGVLGVAPADDAIPPVIEDDHEQRLKAALQILQIGARAGRA
jgi:tetratricopeptide (TPR) repeat protein